MVPSLALFMWAARRSGLRVPAFRTKDGKEAKIPAYELLKDGGPAAKKVHDSVLAGVSTRKYRKAVEDSLAAVGVSRSSVSRKFVSESADPGLRRRLHQARLLVPSRRRLELGNSGPSSRTKRCRPADTVPRALI